MLMPSGPHNCYDLQLMTYDFWTTAAIADELRRTIAPGRVQQVVQVDATSLALEIYAGRERRYLLLSADQQAPRVHLLADKPRRGVDTPSTLLQLLRKYVRGSALLSVSTPPPGNASCAWSFSTPSLARHGSSSS